MRNTQNPQVFLDISIGGNLAERIEIELLADKVPKTAKNFLAFFTGEKGRGKHTGKPMYYKGSTFYNIMRGKWAKGGDFSEENGTGGENIYGVPFFDEGSESKHDAPYLLTTADDYQKHTIGSRFLITFNKLRELNGKHVVFGRIVRGFETVQKIEKVQTFSDGKPKVLVIITACGLFPESRSLNSITIRGDFSLPSEERHSRKRKSNGDRVVEHHSESRHHQNQRSHSSQSTPWHYRSKSREKTSPGWNYEGGGSSAKSLAPSHSQSNSTYRTSKRPQWRGQSRKNMQRALGSHTLDRGHSKQQNHSPGPELEFPNLSKSMQMRLHRPGDGTQPSDCNPYDSRNPEKWSFD